MKKLIILFILLSNFTILISQNISVKLGPNYQFYPNDRYENSDFNYTVIEHHGLDTFRYKRTYRATLVNENKYKSQIGFFGGVDFTFELSKKLNLDVGINFNYSKFELSDSTYSFGSELISEEVVPFEPPIFIEENCNYTNSFFDIFSKLNNKKEQTITNLIIPITLKYNLTKDLKPTFGSYIATIISSNYHYQNISIIRNESSDRTMDLCEYVIEDISDRSSSAIRNLNFGITAGIEYWMRNIGAEIKVDQRLTNVFNNKGYSDFQSIKNKSKPLFFNMFIKYRFRNYSEVELQ